MSEDIFNSPEVVVPGLGLILGSLILWSLIILSLTIDFNTHFHFLHYSSGFENS